MTTDEKTDYINSTLCLMNPDMAPAKTGLFGSKSRWDEIQVTHVAQVQFIHTVVSQVTQCLQHYFALITTEYTGSILSVAPLVHDSP